MASAVLEGGADEARQPAAEERANLDVAFHPRFDVLPAGQNRAQVWRYEPEKLAGPETGKDGRRPRPEEIPGKEIAKLNRGGFSLGMAFSADGDRLAAGKNDGTVELWDVG